MVAFFGFNHMQLGISHITQLLDVLVEIQVLGRLAGLHLDVVFIWVWCKVKLNGSLRLSCCHSFTACIGAGTGLELCLP